ncbi:hypothetical protein [Salinithrix halophila]|uniref:ABC-2 type transport system permease protein n=1 Tax=Salinithrix halophila TaxID=1485204 RepID=A0ABV8JFF1_9BACL
MKQWWALLRVILRGQFALSVLRDRYIRKQERLWEPLLTLFFLLFLVPLLLVLIEIYSAVYLALDRVGQPEALLTALVVGGQLWVLFFGFIHLIGQLYFVRDAEALLPLPVTPRQVLGARLVGIWIGQVVGLLPCFLTGFLVYGVLGGEGLPYYLMLVPMLMAMPLLPLALSGAIVLVLMRVTNIRGQQSWWRVLGSMSGILVLIGFQVAANSRGDWKDPEVAGEWLTQPGGLSDMIAAWFPPSQWAVESLVSFQEGAGFGSLFVAGGILAAVIFVWLGGSLYYRGLTASGGKKQSREKNPLSRRVFRSRSLFRTMLAREWQLVMGTPVFIMDAVFPLMMFPAMVLLPSLLGGEGNGWGAAFSANVSPLVAVWAGVGVVVLMGGVNGIAFSAISREGEFFYLSKVIPVSWQIQLAAKWVVTLVFTVISALIVSAGQLWLLGAPVVTLWTLVTSILAASFVNLCGILFDLISPILDWQIPQEAMRRGFNRLWGLFLLFGGALVVLMFNVLAVRAGLSFTVIQVLWLLVLVGLNMGVWFSLKRTAGFRYQRIEG